MPPAELGSVAERASRTAGVVRVLPRVVSAALALWWAAHVGFLTLGVLDGTPIGHQAWAEGFYSFPRWFQGAVAVLGVATWVSGVLVIGGAVALHGGRALRWFAAGAVASTAGGVLLVVLLTWWWPGDAG